ncbi:MAG: DsrE family protein [Flavobacteriaceae bacterium]|jgi:intracellular sulfur oxidation DsrE/DsrF family protein|nr:DsrE family protein [Flavobacteriaceae bacterium]
MKNYFLFFIFLFFQLTFSQEKTFNVVFDVTSSNVKTHQIAVRHVELMSSSYPNSKFEVVLYGGSIEMALDKKSSVRQSILALSQKDNVDFVICEASMRKHKVIKSDLVKGFKTVPDGILEIVEKQIQGWGYIKEAH